jgi:hypothetical protein
MYLSRAVADVEQPQEIQIEIPPELEAGVYTNFALVSAGEHDFVLDLCQLMPSRAEDDSPRARVVVRVRFAPTFVGPLLQAISQNAFTRDELLKDAQEEDLGEGGTE